MVIEDMLNYINKKKMVKKLHMGIKKNKNRKITIVFL